MRPRVTCDSLVLTFNTKREDIELWLLLLVVHSNFDSSSKVEILVVLVMLPLQHVLVLCMCNVLWILISNVQLGQQGMMG